MVTRTRADDARVPTEPMREYHAAGLGEAHRDRMDRRATGQHRHHACTRRHTIHGHSRWNGHVRRVREMPNNHHGCRATLQCVARYVARRLFSSLHRRQTLMRNQRPPLHCLVALDRRGAHEGIRAFSVHPGRIETDLQRHISIADLQAMGFHNESGEIPADQRHMYKTVAQGAATALWCATSPLLDGKGGGYCEDCDIAPAVSASHKALNGALPWAIDVQLAEQLWARGEEWGA